MSKKGELFISELVALCKKHKVEISTNMYDDLVISDMEGNEDYFINWVIEEIEDKTKD